MVFDVAFSTENKHPLISEFLLQYSLSFERMRVASNNWFLYTLNVKPLSYLFSPLFNEMAATTRKNISELFL